jgi:peptidoglycan/xylan/chitin deacetylase (PgdA/CDA1 family)
MAQRHYAKSWISKSLAIDFETSVFPDDILALVFSMFSLTKEIESEPIYCPRNKAGACIPATADQTLREPCVDNAVQKKWAKVSRQTLRNPLSFPGNKPFAICLTHDVDFISRRNVSMSFLGELIRRYWKMERANRELFGEIFSHNLAKFLVGPLLKLRKKDEYHNFDRCMDLELHHGFKSTFFFMAACPPFPHAFDCGYLYSDPVKFYGKTISVRAMMREMLQRGWDIGLHSSYNAAQNLDALIEEKQQLEKCVDGPISSVRNHYLNFDPSTTPTLLETAGFLVDSTVGYNYNVGFRTGTAFPHYCWNHAEQKSTNVLEIPLHVMDVALLGENGLNYDAKMALKHALVMMDRVEAVGGILNLNWHPAWMNHELFIDTYKKILAEAEKRNAWGCTIGALFEHVSSPNKIVTRTYQL